MASTRFLSCVLLLLTGCAFEKKSEKPIFIETTIPSDWSEGAEEPSELLFPFHAPEVEKWFELAQEKNPSFLQAVEAVKALRQRELISQSSRIPLLNWGIDGSHRQSHLEKKDSSFRSVSHALNFGLSWEADLWGRLGELSDVEKANRNIGELDRESMRISLLRQISLRWLSFYEYQQRYLLIEKELQVLNRLSEVYRLDLQIDTEASTRFLTVQRRVRNLKIQQRDLQSFQAEENILLRELLGGKEISTRDLPVSATQLKLTALGTSSLQQILGRPDVLRSGQKLKANLSHQRASNLAWWPRLRFSLSGGVSSKRLKSLLDTDYLVWTLASSISQELFQGKRKEAEKALAESNVKSSLHHCVEVVLNALSEVDLAIERDQGHRHALELLLAQGKDLKRIEQQWKDQFQSGDGGVGQGLEVQLDLVSLEQQTLLREVSQARNRLDLYFALGGGFEGLDGVHPPKLAKGESF